MAFTVEAGTPLAQAIQTAVQPKLVENGWAAEESDTTLAEYVTMMLVNNKDADGVKQELGGDLLGVGEDDAAVGDFAQWLFQAVPQLNAQVNGAPAPDQSMQSGEQPQMQDGQTQPIPTLSDAQMDDAGSATQTDGVPSGPKAMRNGGGQRGRGGRMLGQMNRQMDRNDPNDALRRIKGAASGGAGRIDAHAGRPPRGPRGQGLQNGVNRMMNGRGGGQMGAGVSGPGMMAQQPGMAALNPQQQMQFMQLMEQQAAMMTQIFNGQAPAMNQGGFQQNGGSKSLFDRVDNKTARGRGRGRGGMHGGQGRDHIDGAQQDSGSMEVEMTENGVAARKDPFDTVCKFNLKCTNPSCPFAHQSPAAPPGTTIDTTDRCSFGAACENKKCAGKHPSPGQRRQHLKDEVDCKFYPNCTNPACPFRHPDMPPCRNGADCTVADCKFVHSKIMCRYNPCLNPHCTYKHADGQKRGKFSDKVWTANGNDGEGFDRDAAMKGEAKADRFAGIAEQTAGGEELITPSQEQSMDAEAAQAPQAQQDNQIVT